MDNLNGGSSGGGAAYHTASASSSSSVYNNNAGSSSSGGSGSKRASFGDTSNVKPAGTRETRIEDFDILKTIGTGTFARVYLCR